MLLVAVVQLKARACDYTLPTQLSTFYCSHEYVTNAPGIDRRRGTRGRYPTIFRKAPSSPELERLFTLPPSDQCVRTSNQQFQKELSANTNMVDVQESKLESRAKIQRHIYTRLAN